MLYRAKPQLREIALRSTALSIKTNSTNGLMVSRGCMPVDEMQIWSDLPAISRLPTPPRTLDMPRRTSHGIPLNEMVSPDDIEAPWYSRCAERLHVTGNAGGTGDRQQKSFDGSDKGGYLRKVPQSGPHAQWRKKLTSSQEDQGDTIYTTANPSQTIKVPLST